MMQSPIQGKHQRKACMRRKGGRSECTWRHASSSAGTSTPLLVQWMYCWVWRQRQNLKRISSCPATKWWQPYSRMCRYVKSRIAITLVRATHWCIWGSGVPAHRIGVQRPQWEDGAKLNLFR